MKHNTKFKQLSSYIAVAGLSIFLATCASTNTKQDGVDLSNASIKSINMGIKSDVTGVKKHAIEFAGMYLVDQSSSTLIDQFEVEKDPNIRILILKALYLIDNNKYMSEIRDLATNDKDKDVKQFAQSLYPVFQAENN